MPGAEPPGRRRGEGHAKIAAGFLITARWLVPVEPAGAVLEHHAVAIRDGAIERLLPFSEASNAFPDYERIELPDRVLMPGLVNAHTHAAMALLRGLPDDPRAPAWPVPPRELSPAFVRDGTLLACAEMLRGGITCFADSYFFPEAALEAALDAGMRCAAGLAVIDAPSTYASDPTDYLRKGLALRDRYREHALASFYLAPDSSRAVPDAVLRQVATLAAELDLPVRLRLRPGEVLRADRSGLLGPGLAAVHAVDLDPAEIALLARHGCSVVHCAVAAARRARGAAPLEAIRAAGLNLCLGTDAPPANHRFDLFAEMRATPLPGHDVLHAATLGGACALGLGERIGSIVPGKAADLIAVALPPALLACAAGPEHVTHVWVDGKLLVG